MKTARPQTRSPLARPGSRQGRVGEAVDHAGRGGARDGHYPPREQIANDLVRQASRLTDLFSHARLAARCNMTVTLHEQFVLDAHGHPRAVLLPIKEYKRLLALLEDAADLEMAKERLKEPRIPFAQVTAELKRDGLV